jgi:hypothetical protein
MHTIPNSKSGGHDPNPYRIDAYVLMTQSAYDFEISAVRWQFAQLIVDSFSNEENRLLNWRCGKTDRLLRVHFYMQKILFWPSFRKIMFMRANHGRI